MSLYYTLEAGYRSIRKLMLSMLQDPQQSTVSTPRCLSPTNMGSKKSSPQTPKTPDVIRQKVPMNEPVNCVFIRPVIPKTIPEGTVAVPNLNSEEDILLDRDHCIGEKGKKINGSLEKDKKVKESGKEKIKKETKKSPQTMTLDEVQFDASSNFNIRP